jgi:hypothetical protein
MARALAARRILPWVAASALAVGCRADLAVPAAGARPVALSVPPSPTPSAAPSPSEGVSVDTEMRNVDLHITESVTLRVRELRGRFVGQGAGTIPVLDDKLSYVVEIDSGEIGIGTASLTALMNEHVFGHPGAPVKDLEVSVKEGRLQQKGKLDKAIDIPFKVKGAVEATPDGKIRVHAKSIRGAGLPVKPLMKLFGIELDDLVKVEPGHGLSVDDNDFILDPQLLLPPPRIRGRISAVRIEGNEVVQAFGDAPRRPAVPGRSRNHIYFQKGELRFGKLTMHETDLELVDQDPSDPFDFAVDHWSEMLVAGYSKTLVNRGLRTFMPDYADLKAGRRGAARPPAARDGGAR